MSKKKNSLLQDYNVGGKKVKKNKTLEVNENKTLESMKLSKVVLNPKKITKKETLHNEEKICFIINGNGTVYLNDLIFTVQSRDVILFPKNSTFQIENYADHNTLHYNMVSC